LSRPLSVFIVAGEQSGDQLGFKLIRALRDVAGEISVRGVGGPRMIAEGMTSLFPLEDVAVMGFAEVIARLPLLRRRIRETAEAVIADPPDILVIVDSPDFTHRVARMVRTKLPSLPVVDYVSPTVWAWRPSRARKMRAYVDHVLALLPFEPAAHARLGGPACSYVGHPLIERLDELRPKPGERTPIEERANLLVLPGSRASVVRRHMPLFGEVIGLIARDSSPIDITIPAVPSLAHEIAALAKDWPVAPRIVTGETDKLAVMRSANVALAVSGTGTLELALSGVPLVGAYRIELLAKIIRRFVAITAQHILLPNLILETRAIPEFAAEAARADDIAAALRPLLHDTPERRAQEAALKTLDQRMAVPDVPSRLAARIVFDMAVKVRL
jgi:lipid-A-disaccharide synthase